jgi:hypothetical protein
MAEKRLPLVLLPPPFAESKGLADPHGQKSTFFLWQACEKEDNFETPVRAILSPFAKPPLL